MSQARTLYEQGVIVADQLSGFTYALLVIRARAVHRGAYSLVLANDQAVTSGAPNMPRVVETDSPHYQSFVPRQKARILHLHPCAPFLASYTDTSYLI